MKAFFDRSRAQHAASNDAVQRATLRYAAAFAEYQGVVGKNAELNLSGGKPSPQALLEEERAFEELDCARHALFDAAALAYPTVH